MSAQFDIIVAVLKTLAVYDEDFGSLPDHWTVQLAIDTRPRYEMVETPPARGTENWSKWEHTEMLRFRTQDQLDRPINHEVFKGLKLKHPVLMMGDQPTSEKRGGTYYWKLLL